MPKLRYYKRFEVIDEETFEGRGTSTDENEQRDEKRFELSGQSWWSNRNIITGLSDTKIKQAIGYHKQMVIFLENELCARISTPRRYTELRINDSLSYRENGGQSIHETILRKRMDLSSNLRTRIKSIRRQYGTMAAEKVKKEWEIILQQYKKGA